MLLNEKAKERIKRTGIKQRFLADKLGIHEVSFTNILLGRMQVSEELVNRIAYELHMDPDEIIQTQHLEV
ncbi:MAG TPA: helix-turn-helix transcriptional regulator [bacterium]|nr:helix-turn-helix transcriptional regulator [bacterium]